MISYNPLISIIIAVYNGERYVGGAIESIINQNYTNYELIIIDGGSTDNTTKVISTYSKHIKYTISEPDKGIYDAWNKGLKVASGKWISFLGSDDSYYPNALKAYVDFIGNLPEKDSLEFVSSKIDLVNSEMKIIETVGEAWEWERFKHKMITWHVGSFHSRELFTKYGMFDDSYKISGDYEFLMRPKNRLRAAYLPYSTVMMRTGGVSTTLLFKAIDETYRAKVKNELLSRYTTPLLVLNNKIKLSIKMFLVKKGIVKKL
ncbi:glycosyltransferase family 2 protein [Spirosoma aerophilum]